MRLLHRIRNRSRSARAGEGGGSRADPGHQGQLPIANYDQLQHKAITEQLSALSQLELSALEAYERSHRARPAILDKLRYMREDEPLPGYDALSSAEIRDALGSADSEKVKAVRDYERKFGHRPQVLEEAARVLPAAAPSPAEDRAREGKDARVRAGTRSASFERDD